MANARNGNTFFVDTSSAATTSAGFLSDKNLKLIGIVFTANTAASDILDIYDKDPNSSAAGIRKLSIRAGTAKDTMQVRLEDTPLVFPNGVWVTLTGTPTATLIFTTQGN